MGNFSLLPFILEAPTEPYTPRMKKSARYCFDRNSPFEGTAYNRRDLAPPSTGAFLFLAMSGSEKEENFDKGTRI
jgi:hypothetical protein